MMTLSCSLSIPLSLCPGLYWEGEKKGKGRRNESEARVSELLCVWFSSARARPPVTHEGRVGIRSSERELGQIGIRWRVLKGYFALSLFSTPIHARLAQFAIPFLSLPLGPGEGLAA